MKLLSNEQPISNDIFREGYSGSTTGFRSYSLRIPSEKITVVIYTNTTDFGGLKRKALSLASYFSDGKIPFPAYVLLEKDIEENGIDNITAKFSQLKSDNNKYDIVKEDLRALGFSYFKKEPENSLKLFELIKVEFPDFYAGHFGLAQYYAYKTKGNNEKAVEYYKKAIELLPDNEQRLIKYSKGMIKKLSE